MKEKYTAKISLSPQPFPFFRINMCPNNCSGHGVCRLANSSAAVQCECEEGWKSDACDVPYCASDCGYPLQGRCQITDERCLCNPGWQGEPTLCAFANKSKIIFTENGENRTLCFIILPLMVGSVTAVQWRVSLLLAHDSVKDQWFVYVVCAGDWCVLVCFIVFRKSNIYNFLGIPFL